jgi:hypothetical protein
MTKNDLNLYREMSQPFMTAEAATDALQAFFEDLGELRKKHEIPDLVCAVKMGYLTSDGVEVDGMSYVSYGDQMNVEPMAAYLYGQAAKDRQEFLAKIVRDAGGLRRPAPKS